MRECNHHPGEPHSDHAGAVLDAGKTDCRIIRSRVARPIKMQSRKRLPATWLAGDCMNIHISPSQEEGQFYPCLLGHRIAKGYLQLLKFRPGFKASSFFSIMGGTYRWGGLIGHQQSGGASSEKNQSRHQIIQLTDSDLQYFDIGINDAPHTVPVAFLLPVQRSAVP